MKQEFLISRLDEPNIAYLYVMEVDQNLLNNIRVLCTRQPETLRYFVPQELFWKIRNGEPVAFTAECFDVYGRKLFTVDPLKVLSEQLMDRRIVPEDCEGLDIRIRVSGYPLPAPGDDAEVLVRPMRYRKTPPKNAGTNGGSSRKSGSSKKNGGSGKSGSKGGGAYSAGADAGSSKGGSGARAERGGEDPTFRRRKKSPVKGILLALMILAAAAGVWFMRDTSVKRLEDNLNAAHYAEAVKIYNGEILGHESREEKADPQIKGAVGKVRDRYMQELCSYNDTCTYLGILAEVDKKSLSDLAQSALADVELYEASSTAFKEAVDLMENREYLAAIEAFLKIEESSPVYEEAQKNIETCVNLLVRSTSGLETEEDCFSAIEMLDAALELLPENEALSECRESCLSKYHILVRNNAIKEAGQLAADGDFEGAFARIDSALEILPEDEQLLNKAGELRTAFVAYVTGTAVDLVNDGDFDTAYEAVNAAMELYECEEFESLYAQIEEGESGIEREVSELTAGKVAFTEYPGEIKGFVRKKEYSVTAQGGPCSFVFTKADSKLKMQLVLKGPDGKEVVRQSDLVAGSEVNCALEKGKTYTAVVEAAEGEGSYVLRLGQQKAPLDVSAYELVRDSMEFKGQTNYYTFIPENSGIYRFDITSGEKDLSAGLGLYDSKENKIFEDVITAGDGAAAELEAGETYTLAAAQTGGTGEYDLRIGKQEAPEEIDGKCIVPGLITYKDQQNIYTFRAADSGEYKITVSNMDDECMVKMHVFSQLGDRLEGSDDLWSGDSVTVILKEGQSYKIQLTQLSGISGYTITMRKE